MLRLRQLLVQNRMTQVKLTSGGRPAVTRKMQRYSLFKAVTALLLCLGFVALLFQNDPFPGVRKAAMRHRKQAEVDPPSKERDFREPPKKDGGASEGVAEAGKKNDGDSSAGGVVGELEEGGREFTFELASLTGGETGTITIRTKPSWAPLGVAHFHELVDDQFYDKAKFFRVVDNFVVQFGIPADPKNKRPAQLRDDPVISSNVYGTLTYATSGPNTRTTQLFINTRKAGNKFLDKQGFAPFAEVISGMDFVERIYNGYGEKPNQGKIQIKGNEYLDKEFPLLSYVSKAYGDGSDGNEDAN